MNAQEECNTVSEAFINLAPALFDLGMETSRVIILIWQQRNWLSLQGCNPIMWVRPTQIKRSLAFGHCCRNPL
jgi:hypothetical protein